MNKKLLERIKLLFAQKLYMVYPYPSPSVVITIYEAAVGQALLEIFED